MKRRCYSSRSLLAMVLALVLVICLGTSCSTPTRSSITVSIPPLKGLTEEICGDSWEIHSLVPTGQNPEDYQPTIEEMVQLEESQALFYLSLPAELVTVEKIRTGQPHIVLIDLGNEATSRLSPIHITEDQLDPHIWLSPKRALLLTEIILETLLELDPDHAEDYRSNQEQLVMELQELDAAWEQTLADRPNRTFLMYHPALSYLALDYDLEMISIEQHGKEPDLKELDRTIQLAQDKGIKTVLYQNEFPREEAEAIAREIGADTRPLSLLEEDYMTMMYDLLQLFDEIL